MSLLYCARAREPEEQGADDAEPKVAGVSCPRRRCGGWQGIGLALSDVGGPKFEGVPVGFMRREPAQQ